MKVGLLRPLNKDFFSKSFFNGLFLFLATAVRRIPKRGELEATEAEIRELLVGSPGEDEVVAVRPEVRVFFSPVGAWRGIFLLDLSGVHCCFYLLPCGDRL